MRRLTLAAVAVSALAAPEAAHAAAPANDAPAGAIAFAAQTAENGTPTEKQGVADLTEATADAGVPRCLGAASFERTVWYRVPATAAVRTIRVTGTGGVGQSAAQPDLAAFVVPAGSNAPAEPQACDGGEVEPAVAGGDPGGAPEVDVRVPAGAEVLVQVGRPADQAPERVILSEAEIAQPATPSPAGDIAGADTGKLTNGTTATVALGGATLTPEDPAEPACPASATVWRRYVADGTGTQTVHVLGDAVTAVTAFVGDHPTADNAVSCQQRTTPGLISMDVPAQRGQTVWVRVGTESSAPDASAAVNVRGPAAPGGPVSVRKPKVSVGLVSHRRKVRLRATGGSLRSVRVTIQRRRGKRYVTVGTASVASLTSGKAKTVKVKRRAGISAAGRFRFLVKATTKAKPAKRITQTRTKKLSKL